MTAPNPPNKLGPVYVFGAEAQLSSTTKSPVVFLSLTLGLGFSLHADSYNVVIHNATIALQYMGHRALHADDRGLLVQKNSGTAQSCVSSLSTVLSQPDDDATMLRQHPVTHLRAWKLCWLLN